MAELHGEKMEGSFVNQGKVVVATIEPLSSETPPGRNNLPDLPKTSTLARKRFVGSPRFVCSTARCLPRDQRGARLIPSISSRALRMEDLNMRIHHVRLCGISDAFPKEVEADFDALGPGLIAILGENVGAYWGSKPGRFMIEITEHYSCVVSGLSGWLSET